jgi:hypothetical protein
MQNFQVTVLSIFQAGASRLRSWSAYRKDLQAVQKDQQEGESRERDFRDLSAADRTQSVLKTSNMALMN